jgi:hypothetical protein
MKCNTSICAGIFFLEACFHEAACIAVDMIQNTLSKQKWVQNSCKNVLDPSKFKCFTLMYTWRKKLLLYFGKLLNCSLE